MKPGKKRLISGVIFSCLAMPQNTAFAALQEMVETNNYSDVLEDLRQPANIEAIARDLEDPFKQQGKLMSQLQKYETNEFERIRAVISHGVQNRFQIKGKKIREVIGQGFLYKINSDESGNHVFITPLAVKGERIDLTFVYDNDKAVDLSLLVKEGVSQSIVINEKELSDAEKSSDVVTNYYEQEIAVSHLLKMMIKDRKSKYDVEILNKKVTNILSGEDVSLLEFVIDRRYGWAKDNLKGLRVIIKNRGYKSMWLNKELLNNLFEDIKFVHIAKKELPGLGETFAYVIRNDSRFGQNGEKE
jgi:TraK protein